jgi:hypothetical protein
MRHPLSDKLLKFGICKREKVSVEWNFHHLIAFLPGVAA